MTGKTDAPGEHAGDLLRKARLESGLTQEDLAERFPGGISVDTISNIERGRVRPRRHTLLGLLDALDVSEVARGPVIDAWRSQARSGPPGAAVRHRLPSPITALVGRERELDTLTSLLADEAVRLVTLTGPGGVGKTRLALAAAETAAANFRDGAAFIDLTSIREPDRLLPAVAFGLGLADAGDRPVGERLIAYLGPKDFLLLLDNSEAVVDGATQLIPLLENCPGMTLLATSREPFRLRGEHELPVPPLPLPAAPQIGSLEELENVPSVQLLLQRGRMVSPGLKLSEANAGAMTQICARLDGLPLALELAGARLKHLAPEALAVRLERALSVLVDGPRDLPERQRTLRATIDWSYALLTEPEQRLLRRLAVFVDGCTGEAVMRVCGEGEAGDDAVTQAALDGLLDKNLLTVIDDGAESEPRFGMLETVREYAAELLVGHGDAAATRDLHARFFCELAEAAFPALYSAERLHWLAILGPEGGNFNAALQWCLEEAGDREVGVRLAGALGRFWYFRAQVNHGRAWLAKALGSPAASRASLALARALYAAGKLAFVQGDYQAAIEHGKRAAAIAAEFPGEVMVEDIQTMLGYSFVGAGKHQDALDALHGAMESARRHDARWQLAFAKTIASEAARMAGDLERARRYVDEGLGMFEALGDPWAIAVANAMAAGLSKDLGDQESMKRHIDEFESSMQVIGEEKYMAVRAALMHGYIELMQNDIWAAAPYFDKGLTCALEFGQTAYILVAFAGAASIATFGGEPRAAATLFAAAAPVLKPDAIYVDDGGKAAREASSACLEIVKASLTTAEYEAATEAGRRISMEDAVGLARRILATRPPTPAG